MRDTIRKILREEVNKQDKLLNIIMDHMIKNFTTFDNGEKPTDLSVYNQWTKGFVSRDLETVFGITEKDQPELYKEVIDSYISEVTGLLKKGTRVRLIGMKDPYTKLKRGDEGTIVDYNWTPWGAQYMMKWDNGSSLDLVPEEDEFEVLS